MNIIRRLLISLCLLPIHALAFDLSPMVQSVNDFGSQNTTFFKVTNTSLAPLPIEMSASKRQVTLNNQEALSETDDLMIFPPQVLIQPGKTQTIKVMYIGNPKHQAESYRLIVSQLPLNSEVENDSIQMLFRIGALLFVSPMNAQEQYTSNIALNDANEPMLTIENTGSSVMELTQYKDSVNWNGKKHSWDWQALEALLPMQYLVPNQRVEINVNSLLSK